MPKTKLNNPGPQISLLKDGQTTYFNQVQLTLTHTKMLTIRLEIFRDSQHLGLEYMPEGTSVMASLMVLKEEVFETVVWDKNWHLLDFPTC